MKLPAPAVAADAEELPYDRIARLGRDRWWIPPLSILTTMFAWFLAFGCLAGLGEVIPASLPGHLPRGWMPSAALLDDISTLGAIALFAPAALLTVRLVQRRPAGTLLSVDGRLRWRWLGICAALSGVLPVLLVSGLAISGERLLAVGWAAFLPIAALLLVLVPLQTAGEECLTRGLALQSLGLYGRWVGVAGSAVFFAVLHGIGTWYGFGALALGAAVWALLVIRTGGLEVSIAAHASGNLTALLLAAADGDVGSAGSSTAADAPAWAAAGLGAADIVYALLILGALRLLARYRPGWLPAKSFARRGPGGRIEE
jgi:membrane protease YdiL (CAAX protease family)